MTWKKHLGQQKKKLCEVTQNIEDGKKDTNLI